jgi:hypothetical protein
VDSATFGGNSKDRPPDAAAPRQMQMRQIRFKTDLSPCRRLLL